MKESIIKSDFNIKHILSSDWIPVKYISDDGDTLQFLIEDTNNMYFEKDDKIIYSVKSKNKDYIYNTVVDDIDFPTYNKFIIKIKKPFERRKYSRFNVNLQGLLVDFNCNCNVVDISPKGLKILTKQTLSIKDNISVKIYLTDTDVIICNCDVIYKQLSNNFTDEFNLVYGLSIKDISFEDKTILKEFLLSLK